MLRNLILFISLAIGPAALAQTVDDANQPSTFVSAVDKQLSINTITLLPVTDNVDGIYSRPIENYLNKIITQDHHWNFVENTSAGTLLTPTELESKPDEVKRVGTSSKVDAVIALRLSKASTGVSIEMNLFLTFDGHLYLQENLKDYPRFDLNDLQEQVRNLYFNLTNKIPYRGVVMSRQGTRVTLNLGKKDGLQPEQVLNAIQIITVSRHPKFHFLISTEKEVLGKIRILKVDERLSFGVILSEKGRGAIQKGSKLAGSELINYSGNESVSLDPNSKGNLESRPDSMVSFGKNPSEWVPVEAAKYGAVFFKLGLGPYAYNTQLNNYGAVSATSSFMPSLALGGELWITPNWTMEAAMKQGIVNVDNPRSGSTPTALDIATSKYEFAIAYNILMQNEFFGPKIQTLLGFQSFKTSVTESSALTTTTYSGYKLGVRGSLPITADKRFEGGAELFYFISTSLAEGPASSGASASSNINSFSLFGSIKLNHRMMLTGSLDFESYFTTFNGAGTRAESASSSNQRITSLNGGIKYLF